jgi:hypothetical protein
VRTTTRWKRSAAIFLLLFFSRDVYSAHPLLTEDTGTQGKGGWQLEVNGERQKDPQPSSEEAPVLRAVQSGTTLSYGVTETVDFKVDLPYVRHEGILDIAVGFKWRFYEDGPLSFGTQLGVFLPTGDEQKGLGAGKTNAGAAGIVSWQGERWEFHSHAGLRTNQNVIGQRDWLGHLSAAALYRLWQPFRVLLDVAWDSNPQIEHGTLRNTVVGFIWSVTKDFDLDAGYRKGNDAAIDTAILFGATLRW